MIANAQHCSGGGLSYDDVDLFGRLRSLTIVRGLALPDTVRKSLVKPMGLNGLSHSAECRRGLALPDTVRKLHSMPCLTSGRPSCTACTRSVQGLPPPHDARAGQSLSVLTITDSTRRCC